jgi:hypothetical protein
LAATSSTKNPHQWPDGTWHSITYQQHVKNQNQKPYNPVGYNPANIQNLEQATGQQSGGPDAGQPLPKPDVPLTQPFDPEFEATKLGATWNVSLSDAEAGYQSGNLAYDTGYDANGQRNSANPYNQAQMLEDNYHRSQLGTTNSYAAQGQYNSGAYGRAQGHNDRLYAQGSDRLQRDTADAYHGIRVGQLQTYAGNALGVSGDSFEALKKAIYGG